jgi:hypothetical protein
MTFQHTPQSLVSQFETHFYNFQLVYHPNSFYLQFFEINFDLEGYLC